MPTPMHVYYEIAERCGIDPTNENDVDDFFVRILAQQPLKTKSALLEELLSRGGEEKKPIPGEEGWHPLTVEEKEVIKKNKWICFDATKYLQKISP